MVGTEALCNRSPHSNENSPSWRHLMKRQMWLGLLAISPVTIGAQSPANAYRPDSGVILGQVTDKETGKPIHNAKLWISGLTRERLSQPGRYVIDSGAISNLQGRYLLPNLPNGTHTLMVRRDGYADATETVSIKDGRADTLNLVLEPSRGGAWTYVGDPWPFDLGGMVNGHVTDKETGTPIVGATVSVVGTA